MKNYITQINIGTFSGPGTGPLSQTSSPGVTLNSIVSTIIGALTGIASIYFIFMFFIGAIQWIGAGNDQKKIESARGKITTGTVGIIIAIAAIFIIDILGNSQLL